MCLINQFQPQVLALSSTVGLPQREVGHRAPMTEDSVKNDAGSLVIDPHGCGMLLPLYITSLEKSELWL